MSRRVVMRLGSLLFAIVVVTACRKQEAAPQEAAPASKPSASTTAMATASASVTPQPPKTPEISVVAKAPEGSFEMRNALAWAYEGSPVVHIELSTHARTCKDLDGDHTRLVPGEQVFEVVVAPPLDGKNGWNIGAVFQTNAKGTVSPVIGSYGRATIAASDPKQTVKGEFASPMTGDVTLTGAFEAKPCGRTPRPEPEAARSEHKALTLEIDGKRVPIMGARYDESRKVVRLSGGGLACGSDPFEEAVELLLEDDEARLIGFAVNGETKFDDSLKYTVGTPANGSVAVSFNLDVKVGEHKVKLTGKDKLTACE